MVAAAVRISWYGGSASEPAGVNAEDNAGIVFNREDSKAGLAIASGVPLPLAPATNYSWPKLLALEVTGVGTTGIANRRISLTAPMPTGTHWYAQNLTAYQQPASVGPDAATDATPPGAYTEVTSTALFQWDNTSVSTAALGRNGNFCRNVFGVDSQYAAGGGSQGTLALPTYRLSYDEA